MASYEIGSVSYAHLVNLKTEIESALKAPRSNLTRAALIKFFELAYEQSWKILRKILMRNFSIETQGSRDAFREGAKVGLINDPEPWFKFVLDRNETVHTYNMDTADLIIADLDSFVSELNTLIINLEKIK